MGRSAPGDSLADCKSDCISEGSHAAAVAGVRRVLLTGATGFIGRFCLRALLHEHFEVHCISRRPLTTGGGVHWHQCDLLDYQATRALVARIAPQLLLHAAWYTAHSKFWEAPENSLWVAATLELAAAFADSGGVRLVCAGSGAEYGPTADACEKHRTRLSFETRYGRAKAYLYRALESAARERSIQFAWARIFMPYGPYEAAPRLVPSVIRSLLQAQEVACTNGEQVRDFLYVEDVADAMVALLKSDACGSFDVGSGRPLRIRDFVDMLARELNGTGLVRYGALTYRANEPRVLVPNHEHLYEAAGWHPRISHREGLRRTVEWWRFRVTV